ncbi:hypothetical protein [uncultured Parabacteroides sp.]|uniref:hypothetical protein n=1 Tax=uncultured Parabacteroides sp. TaxID=512312 RepID=UPI0026224BA5|nr:hypothetical protein [uncultured Parabacteroides sp.]
MGRSRYKSLFILCLGIILSACGSKKDKRQVVSLNGLWEIEKTMGELPVGFSAKVQAPGF